MLNTDVDINPLHIDVGEWLAFVALSDGSTGI